MIYYKAQYTQQEKNNSSQQAHKSTRSDQTRRLQTEHQNIANEISPKRGGGRANDGVNAVGWPSGPLGSPHWCPFFEWLWLVVLLLLVLPMRQWPIEAKKAASVAAAAAAAVAANTTSDDNIIHAKLGQRQQQQQQQRRSADDHLPSATH